jgi:hypothetical protein
MISIDGVHTADPMTDSSGVKLHKQKRTCSPGAVMHVFITLALCVACGFMFTEIMALKRMNIKLSAKMSSFEFTNSPTAVNASIYSLISSLQSSLTNQSEHIDYILRILPSSAVNASELSALNDSVHSYMDSQNLALRSDLSLVNSTMIQSVAFLRSNLSLLDSTLSNIKPPSAQCRTISTAWNNRGSGLIEYLERHYVYCNSNEFMQGLVLKVMSYTSYINYQYTCCMLV